MKLAHCVALVVLAASTFLALSCSRYGSLHRDREAKRYGDEAKRLRDAGEYERAISFYRAAIAAGDDSPFHLLGIGTCYEKLERWADALAAYDRAIGDGKWFPPYTRRAHCLRRSQGLDAAVAWLSGLAEKAPRSRKYPHILGGFLLESGEREKAIPHLAKAVELASAAHGFRFDDDGWLVLDETTLAKKNNDYADLWPTLEQISEAFYALGKPDEALRHATMGVAIGQQLARCKGYYSEAEVEAGDVDCRLVRANVYLDRGDLDAAEHEIRLARRRAAAYSGWVRGVKRAQQRLDAIRAAERKQKHK